MAIPLVARPHCGANAKIHEIDCPHCGERLRRRDGTLPRSAAMASSMSGMGGDPFSSAATYGIASTSIAGSGSSSSAGSGR